MNPQLFLLLIAELISQDAIPTAKVHEAESFAGENVIPRRRSGIRRHLYAVAMFLAGAGAAALVMEPSEKADHEKNARQQTTAKERMAFRDEWFARQQEKIAAIDVLLRDEGLTNTTQGELYAEKAAMQSGMLEEVSGALDSITKAIEHDQEKFDYFHRRAELFIEQARKETDEKFRQRFLGAAVSDYTTAMELSAKQDRGTDPTFLLERRAKAYEELGQLEKAIRDLTEVKMRLFNRRNEGGFLREWERLEAEAYEESRKKIEELERRLQEQR